MFVMHVFNVFFIKVEKNMLFLGGLCFFLNSKINVFNIYGTHHAIICEENMTK